MVHGYIHKKGNGNSLAKITVPVEDKITGFLYFDLGERQILSFYNVNSERFFFYNGYDSSAIMLNRFNSFSSTLGKVKSILGRAVYRNTNISNDVVNFIYFCLTEQNKIIKVVLRYDVKNDSYSIQSTATISLMEGVNYEKDDVLLKVFKYTDQYDMVTHDPAYAVYDRQQAKLYLYTVGISETHLYEFSHEYDEMTLFNQDCIVEFPNISKEMETRYMNECPIIIHSHEESRDKIVYIDFVNAKISRTSIINYLPYYKDNHDQISYSSTLYDNGEYYRVSVVDKNIESNVYTAKTYLIDLKNKVLTSIKQKDLNKLNKHALSLNFFFNGGDYVRKEGDRIKIMVRNYTPSLRYPNKSPILVKALGNTNIGFETTTTKDEKTVFVPRIFEDEMKIEELKEKDVAETKFANDFSKNKLLNSIIGNDQFTGLISELNALEEKISDYDSSYYESNKLIRIVRVNDERFDQLMYYALNGENGFDIQMRSSEDLKSYGAITLENCEIENSPNIDFHFSIQQIHLSNFMPNLKGIRIIWISDKEINPEYGLTNFDSPKVVNFSLTSDSISFKNVFSDILNDKSDFENAEIRTKFKKMRELVSSEDDSKLMLDNGFRINPDLTVEI
ncbi:MAG: hypothetical protein IJ772_05210 [Bacilli bacterium]|nr:hypothetical protein [Bacilli bacterium]